VIDIPNNPSPGSNNSCASDDEKNTPPNEPIPFMIPLKPSFSNQNIKVCLINQLHVDLENQVYLFHIYSNPINAGRLPNVYHNLTDIFAEISLDQFVLPPHWGELDHYIDLEPGSKPVY